MKAPALEDYERLSSSEFEYSPPSDPDADIPRLSSSEFELQPPSNPEIDLEALKKAAQVKPHLGATPRPREGENEDVPAEVASTTSAFRTTACSARKGRAGRSRSRR